MKLKTFPGVVVKLSLLLLFCLTTVYGQSQAMFGETHLRQESVHEVVTELAGLVTDHVELAGGDLEKEHTHWVFVFSTGHFPAEPLRAQAARESSLALLQSLAIPGDKVSVYAFEMNVWEHPGSTNNPLLLGDDGLEVAETVAKMFPFTAQAGSVGGHDTELALGEVATLVSDGSTNQVLVMFTNRAASVTTDPSTRPLIGEDSPVYQRFLQSFNRVPAVNRSGASLEAEFLVERADGSLAQNTLDLVVAVAKDFAGEDIGMSRSEAQEGYVITVASLPEEILDSTEVMDSSVSAESSRGLSVWIVVLVILLGASWFLFRIGLLPFGRRADNVEINDVVFALPYSGSDLVCQVVSQDYRADDDGGGSSPLLSSADVPFGEKILGRVYFRRGQLVWEDSEFVAKTLDGKRSQSPVIIGDQGQLVIHGEVRQRPGLPPRPVEVRLDFKKGTRK